MHKPYVIPRGKRAATDTGIGSPPTQCPRRRDPKTVEQDNKDITTKWIQGRDLFFEYLRPMGWKEKQDTRSPINNPIWVAPSVVQDGILFGENAFENFHQLCEQCVKDGHSMDRILARGTSKKINTTGLVATMDVAGDAAPPPTQDNTSAIGTVVVKTEDSVPALATSSADATATTATTGGPPSVPNTAIIKDEDDLWSTPETPTANATANNGTGTGANDVVPLATPSIRVKQEEDLWDNEGEQQQPNRLTVFQRLERIDLQLTCPQKRQALAAMRAHERLKHHELEAGIVSHAGQSAPQRLLPIEQFYGLV